MNSVSALAKAAISVADNSSRLRSRRSSFGLIGKLRWALCRLSARRCHDLWQGFGGWLAGSLGGYLGLVVSYARPPSAALVET